MGTRDSESWEHEVAEAAQALLDGRMGVIEAARAMGRLQLGHGPARDDADLAAFFAIHTKTIDLPIGKERENWGTEALERRDYEIREIEDLPRDFALMAAARLVKKYGNS